MNIKLKGDYLTINSYIAGQIDDNYITLVPNNKNSLSTLEQAKEELEQQGYIVEIKNQY